MRTVLLGELLVDIAMGPFGSNLKVDNFVESGVPVVKGGNLYGYEVGGEFSYVSEEKAQSLKRSIAYPDDIVITHRGTLGQISIVPNEKYPYYLVSQSQLRLTPDKTKVNPRYLLYYLRSPLGQHELMQHAAQVGVPSIATPTKAVKSFKIMLPELEVQDNIVRILGVIDEKIELNRKMNETFEQMGHALFRHYFIDNPEAEQWEEGKFSDVTAVLTGKGSVKSQMSESGMVPLYGANGIMGTSEDYLYDEPLVITGRVGTLGKVRAVTGQAWFSDNVLIMKPKSGYFGYVLHVAKSFDYISMNRGSSQPLITQTDLRNRQVKLPDHETLSLFEDQYKDIFWLQQKNEGAVQTLTSLRDTLVPRLISGRVKI